MVQATPLNLLVKSHLALLLCNIIWACDYPFYNLVLSKYVAPIALVTASLCAAALFSLVPLLWSKAKPIARKDIKTMIGAAEGRPKRSDFPRRFGASVRLVGCVLHGICPECRETATVRQVAGSAGGSFFSVWCKRLR